MRVRAGELPNLSSTGEDAGRQLVQQKGEDGMMEDEYNFNSEVTLDATSYAWQDKYKPRKPRFFNRVHTVCGWVGQGVWLRQRLGQGIHSMYGYGSVCVCVCVCVSVCISVSMSLAHD